MSNEKEDVVERFCKHYLAGVPACLAGVPACWTGVPACWAGVPASLVNFVL